jgi:predicted nucleic acid-binding Zn ribbon protein
MAFLDKTIPRGNSRRDAPVKCAACGRTVGRKSRQQRFCSDRCRVYSQRENARSRINARTAIKNPVVGQGSESVTKPLKNCRETNNLQGAKSGSSIPLNVLGGYRWADAPKLDSETLERICHLEVGAK